MVDADLMQRLGARGKADVAQHRPKLLRKAGEVEHRDAAMFQMRGHADQRANGDHAGAADAGHQQVVGTVERCRLGQGSVAARPAASIWFAPFVRRVAPSTVTKLGQKPLRQEKSLLQAERLI